MTPLKCTILTVSDTRTASTDTSGDFLATSLKKVGHELVDRSLVVDNIYVIRAAVSRWIADAGVEVVLCTGGTGFSGRDRTPEALEPLFDKPIPGFGELFRQLSVREIGSSTVQSRACAGVANQTFIFAVPGSTSACRTAWEQVLREQLDSTWNPCNFAEIILRRRQSQ